MPDTVNADPPSFRAQLLHLADVAAMKYSGLPEGVILGYGTAMLYQTVLTALLVAESEDAPTTRGSTRWLRVAKGEISFKFGQGPVRIPNNGRRGGSLLANCLKFDPLLRALFVDHHAEDIIAAESTIDQEEGPVLVVFKEPPPWLWVNGDRWAALVAAGNEIDRLADLPSINSHDLHQAMQRRILSELLDLYEPK